MRARQLFRARLPDSVVGLSLPASDVAPSRAVFEAARALAAAEAWLPLLEDWLGAGLLPEPVPGATDAFGESLMFNQHAVLSNEETGVDVHLPLTALAARRVPPPETLAGWTWRPVVCELVLDTLPLSAEDLRNLEPGAVLLLPASFSATWHGCLQPVSGQGGAFLARLHETRGRLGVTATGDEGDHPANDLAAARFAQPVMARPHDLFGWRAGGRPQLLDTPALPGPGAIVLQASPLHDLQPLAAGQLIPVGSGFGVQVQEVLSTFEPAPIEPDISLA
jgi:hypothetical protein